MRHGWLPLLAAVACIPDVEPPETSNIACVDDGDCPAEWSCVTETSVCVSDAARSALPDPVVTFISPADESTRVSVEAPIIIAFSVAVSIDSLAEHLTLNGAKDYTLTAQGDGGLVTIQASLTPETPYALRIDGGVLPAAGVRALPSRAIFEANFVTAGAVDRVPPAALRQVVVDYGSDGRVRLSWEADADVAGTIVVRSPALPDGIVTRPGDVYVLGDPIGSGVVIGAVGGQSFVDTDNVGGSYVLIPYDAARNYGAAVSPPALTASALRFCADSRIHFRADTLAPAEVTLSLDKDDASDALSTGADQSVERSDFGSTWTARMRVQDASGGIALSPPTTLTVASPITIISQPLDIGIGGTASMEVGADGWDALEFAIGSGTTWASLAQPSTSLTTPGTHRFRVRPAATGCADAPWLESAPFEVGAVAYVSQGGRGDKSGVDAENAAAALADVAPAADVRVALGVYEEAVAVASTLKIRGSYLPDFRSRTLPAVSTFIIGPTRPVFSVTNGDLTLEGLRISATPTTGNLAIVATNSALRLDHIDVSGETKATDGEVQITRANLQNTQVAASTQSAALTCLPCTGFVRDSVIRAGEPSASSSGAFAADISGTVELSRNWVIGHATAIAANATGLRVAGTHRIENNVILGPQTTLINPNTSFAVLNNGASLFLHNTIIAHSGNYSQALRNESGTPVVVNNLLVASDVSDSFENAFYEPDAAQRPAAFRNNLLIAATPYTSGGLTNYTTGAEINGLGGEFAGNAVLTGDYRDMFVDLFGDDTELTTLQGADFRLVSATYDNAGLDATTATCASVACDGSGVDIEGRPRDATPTPGAFEKP